MIISGNETQSELKNKCTGGAVVEKGITVNQEYLLAVLGQECSDKEKLCLTNLFVPITSVFKVNELIPSKGLFTLNDSLSEHKFAAFYAKENKELYYRIIDPLSDYLETVNYSFDIDIVTTDITQDAVDVTIDIILTPDNTNYVASWDGIDTISIDGDPFVTWKDINLSWFEVGSANIMNKLKFPKIVDQIKDTILNDGDGNLPKSTLCGNIKSTDGKINFYIELELEYDYDTTTFTYGISNVELQLNEFLDPDITIETNDIAAVAATGIFTIPGSGFPSVGFQSGDSFEINGEIFTEGAEFSIGASDADTAQNFINAINANTNINTLVVATQDYIINTNGGGIITITALTAGVAGNAITISVITGNPTASNITLRNGADAVEFATDSVDDNIATITIDGKFKTITAKRYRSIDSILILSSIDDMKLENIEFYNDSNEGIELSMLIAS